MNTASEVIHEIDEAATPDAKRRQLLLAATSVMGGVGLLATAYPFIARQALCDGISFGGQTLYVEQNACVALEVADYGYVLETGKIALEGPARDLTKDVCLIETYLGAARAK